MAQKKGVRSVFEILPDHGPRPPPSRGVGRDPVMRVAIEPARRCP
jgi:hypothetical protein